MEVQLGAVSKVGPFDSDEVTPSAGCKRPLAMEDIAALDDALDLLCSTCAEEEAGDINTYGGGHATE